MLREVRTEVARRAFERVRRLGQGRVIATRQAILDRLELDRCVLEGLEDLLLRAARGDSSRGEEPCGL